MKKFLYIVLGAGCFALFTFAAWQSWGEVIVTFWGLAAFLCAILVSTTSKSREIAAGDFTAEETLAGIGNLATAVFLLFIVGVTWAVWHYDFFHWILNHWTTILWTAGIVVFLVVVIFAWCLRQEHLSLPPRTH